MKEILSLDAKLNLDRSRWVEISAIESAGRSIAARSAYAPDCTVFEAEVTSRSMKFQTKFYISVTINIC
ncbi:MAG: hypothetical protein J7641_19570 [Cyanobacteria bacterium SID2]|nr:hypothetical protein [Cyanobacteria bacterium SID2]MBP0002227.1 hypothetical protein [Cyanobacteria bacterium SBC]